jgi:hypothetical protein
MDDYNLYRDRQEFLLDFSSIINTNQGGPGADKPSESQSF